MTKNGKKRNWVLIAFVILLLLGTIGACSGGDNTSSTDVSEPVIEQETNVDSEPAEPAPTLAQESCLDKAEMYLDTLGGFSADGLADQLAFEDFEDADIQWAIDHLDVDWNEQAKIKAQQYMDTLGGFSRQSLIDQLMFDQFTEEQAIYGVEAIGF